MVQKLDLGLEGAKISIFEPCSV